MVRRCRWCCGASGADDAGGADGASGGVGNRESGIGNRESGIGNRESGIRRIEDRGGCGDARRRAQRSRLRRSANASSAAVTQ
ncbi:hypothetical protein C5D50_11310 [Rathayibacter sp. RFBD1]|nr:hypothetical protein C5D50_11310 [Rathayibacter sp. RFBD1]PPI56451.1 hypothetical protein C5D38_10860 [Rathayibacter sp. TRS19]